MSWCISGTIHSVRAVGVALPDASLVWQAFMKMLGPIRAECVTIEHFLQNLHNNKKFA